jgi:hypothetical protein
MTFTDANIIEVEPTEIEAGEGGHVPGPAILVATPPIWPRRPDAAALATRRRSSAMKSCSPDAS